MLLKFSDGCGWMHASLYNIFRWNQVNGSELTSIAKFKLEF